MNASSLFKTFNNKLLWCKKRLHATKLSKNTTIQICSGNLKSNNRKLHFWTKNCVNSTLNTNQYLSTNPKKPMTLLSASSNLRSNMNKSWLLLQSNTNNSCRLFRKRWINWSTNLTGSTPKLSKTCKKSITSKSYRCKAPKTIWLQSCRKCTNKMKYSPNTTRSCKMFANKWTKTFRLTSREAWIQSRKWANGCPASKKKTRKPRKK